ncbi:MAG: zinc ribbon domain-containing protein [Lentisphaeria bacterium]|jgi:hypothetical protein|nr:zinc ribbon domain-containing protein [Lentisphaeria bacterium]MDY0175551.1 zinc ribbon domain-containing protein [Lentisphaeria bacterium]NLZ59028.1 zinc-ribbon domain-containing protein [Lentisphaerota bacterium]
MLTCPKCGTENLLNAIFCRGCGERLELDELRPDDLVDTKKLRSQKIARITNIVAGIVLTVLILVVAIGALYPVGGRHSGTDAPADAVKKYDMLKNRGKARSFTFSDEDASALATRQLKSFSGSSGVPSPENISVHFLADGNVRLILSAKLKFLTLHTSLVATPACTGRGSLQLQVQSAKLGLLPLPEALRPKLTDNFKTIAQSTMEQARANISKVEISEGSAKLERGGK